MSDLMQVQDCREPVAEYEFSEFGTVSFGDHEAQSRAAGRKTTGASLVLTSVALLGGLAGTSVGGAQVGTFTSFVTVNRTDRGELMRAVPMPSTTRISQAGTAPASEPRRDNEEVVWIKEHSGLTWDQLGKVFGVSRRAVHMWANGGRLNESNARRLREFSSIIKSAEGEVPEVTPEAVRARLLQVESDGLSIVDRLRRERSSGHTWGAPFGPERLVGAVRTPLRIPVGEVDPQL